MEKSGCDPTRGGVSSQHTGWVWDFRLLLPGPGVQHSWMWFSEQTGGVGALGRSGTVGCFMVNLVLQSQVSPAPRVSHL